MPTTRNFVATSPTPTVIASEAKQSRPAPKRAYVLSGLPRRLRLLVMTAAAVLSPAAAFAHAGHGASAFHTHGLEIAAALVLAGGAAFGLRQWAKARSRK